VKLKSVGSLLPQTLAQTRRASAEVRARPANAWALFFNLISSQIAIGEFKKAFRLARRAVRSPISTWRWLDALEHVRVRTSVERVPYRLARKAGQRFLHHSLRPAATTNLLTMHYERILAALGAQFVAATLRGKVVVAAEIEGRSAARNRLCLARDPLKCREGELNVELVRVDGNRRVASLSIVVGALDARSSPDLWIGGLQGCQGADSKAVTVQATRDLWGLRPKDLLIHAAYSLRDVFGVASLKAISNAGHVLEPMSGKKRGWHADYDAFWRELGGAPIAGDFFLLPEARHRRSVEDVPSAKRRAWRARYALVDQVDADIRALASHAVDERRG
jgi:uncharacterized protein VirK/YbjX